METKNVVINPSAKKPNILLVAIIAISAVILIGIICYCVFSGSKTNNDDVNIDSSAINNYIEYFIYGTENGQNTIGDNSFSVSIDKYAASQCRAEYCAHLVEKFNAIKFNNEQTKKYQGDLLLFYTVSSAILSNSQSNIEYNNQSEDDLVKTSYSIMETYINDANEENHKSLRRQNQLVYRILAESLESLYEEEK